MGLMDRVRGWARRSMSGAEAEKQSFALWLRDGEICATGYTRLSENPEIVAGCLRIAELIGSMTIHLMENTDKGDRRIVNELSRKIDIEPCGRMTRGQWMTAIVMNLLLYGNGNSFVLPHTRDGLLQSLEPVAAQRAEIMQVPGSYTDYAVMIDGRRRNPDDLIHIVYNPDPLYPYMGKGVTVYLKDIANNLKQAQKTANAFLSSEWKPSVIVKVDGLTPEFASPEGRDRLLESYIKPPYPGAPWMIPSEAFSVEQVKPLTLQDIAISDTVTLDKRTVAAMLGVPAWLLGVGDFKRDEWNNFVQSRIRVIALNIQQELTRALIYKPEWYLRLNYWSLMDYDLKAQSDILLAGADRGYVNGDEWRDRMNMTPAGLTEYKVLENYIPIDMIGKQKKLVQGD